MRHPRSGRRASAGPAPHRAPAVMVLRRGPVPTLTYRPKTVNSFSRAGRGRVTAVAAATSSTTTAINRLVRMPGRNDARCAIRAPNTATASVPPTWRLELSRPGPSGLVGRDGLEQQRDHRRHGEAQAGSGQDQRRGQQDAVRPGAHRQQGHQSQHADQQPGCFLEDTEDMDGERAEAYLRQLAEAELRRARTLPAARIPGLRNTARLALVAQALVAVGAVDAGTAAQIRAGLELAVAVRRPGQENQAGPGQRGLPPDERKRLARLMDSPPGRVGAVALRRLRPQDGTHPAGAAPGIMAGSAGRPGDPDPGRRRPPRVAPGGLPAVCRRRAVHHGRLAVPPAYRRR